MYIWKWLRRAKGLSPEAIRNPKFYKLFRLQEDEANEIISIFMKVKGEYDGKDILDIPVGIIYQLRPIFKAEEQRDMEDVTQAVHILTGLSYKKLVKKRTLEICKLYKFVVDGMDSLTNLETKLARKIEAAEHKAGINRLNPFGNLTNLKMVADYYNEGIDSNYLEIKVLGKTLLKIRIKKGAELRPYKECFAVWYYQKEKADFEKNYFEIKNKS